MSLSLSAAITAAKNRLHGNEAWIRLIELPRTASTYLRIASYANLSLSRDLLNENIL